MGTYDHTDFILKKFPLLRDLKINYFSPYKFLNDNKNNKNRLNLGLKIYKSTNLKNNKNLISSYEYCYDIEYYLNKKKIKNYYKIYEGYSRDLKTCFKLKSKF